MWIRILIAGLTGGVIVFVMGAINHMALGLQGRTFTNLPDEPRVTEALRSLSPGIYPLPGHPKGGEASDPQFMEKYHTRYKAGPSGLIVIAPTGEVAMGPQQLGFEWATGTVAALIAAWVVSLAGTDVGYAKRWMAVLAMGVFAWFSLTASYGIWYRFPHDFVHDEFYCAVLEWGLAGLAIAAIVRRPATAANSKPMVNAAG